MDKAAIRQRFESFLRSRGLRHTPQRDIILDTLLSTKRHVSAQELYDLIRPKHPGIGFATVARTLNLLVDADISWVVDFDDGVRRFDKHVDNVRHAHLICLGCQSCIELQSDELDRLKQQLAQAHHYALAYTKLEIFGRCPKCQAHAEDRNR